MARVPQVRAPRANQSAPQPSVRAGGNKGVVSVSGPKPNPGQERVVNGVRQVYRNGRWVRVGPLRNAQPAPPAPTLAPATTAAPPPSAPAAAPLPSGWWASQFAADPRYQTQAPQFAARENQLASTYGFILRRDPTGQALYRLSGSAPGTGDIVQSIDDNGALVYKTLSGTVIPSDQIPTLALDVVEVGQDQPGYTSGLLGRSRMESQGRQFGIGDVSAQAGVGRSGMRAGAAAGEVRALVNALGSLTTRAGSEFAGVNQDRINLFNQIYGDLVEKAKDLAAPPAASEATAPAAPSVVSAGDSVAATAPVAGGGSVNAAGQYTPPASGSVLSSQAFDRTLNEILGPPRQRGPQPMSRGDRIRALRGVLDGYQLTPAQRARVVRELKSLGFVVK